MNTHDYKALSELAQDIARQAGQIALKYKADGLTDIGTKSSDVDMVTAADKACEEYIVERLASDRPDDGLKGEEGASKESQSRITWHIDPIDGTTNFIYGLPFGVSIGAAIRDKPVAGVVYKPFSDQMYAANLGGGSTLNGKQLKVNDVSKLNVSLVGTGFYYDANVRALQAENLTSFISKVRDIRRSGAASLDLCSVASGEIDAYFEIGLNSWDVAAGLLIATEAGAVTKHPFRADWDKGTQLVIGAPDIVNDLHKLVGEGPPLASGNS